MDSMLDADESFKVEDEQLRPNPETVVEAKIELEEQEEILPLDEQPVPEPRELEEGEEDEYDPSKPFVAPFSGAQSHTANSIPPGMSPSPQAMFPPPPPTLTGKFTGPPPPPTLPGNFIPPPSHLGRPPPPPHFPNFAPTLPITSMNSASPMPFPFPPGGFPPPPPTLAIPPPVPSLAVAPPPPTLVVPDQIPSPMSFPSAGPSPIPTTAESEFSPIPGSSYGQQHTGGTSREQKGRRGRGRNRQKGPYSANIQDNLRTALYQDEKYTLHEPVWKVVAGQMTRVHYIETSPTDLPITKLIATKKTDAVAMHKRLLEKSSAAIYYSDGSFKNGWAWGAAVEWVKESKEGSEARVGKKLREELGMCDPTDAEMGGMRKALEAFASVGKLKEQELIIFSDSQAAITLVDSGIRYQSQLFISTLERTLTLHPNVKVSIIWIPGHVGITGNELADRTAVEGLTTTFLARRAGRLPGVPDQEGNMPVILARKKGDVGDGPAQPGSSSSGELKLESPTDDSLIAQAGSLFIARFPEAASANDLEVLFGQFGRLTSIDVFTIPPISERFALISFADASHSDEAIEWLDEKPVTLPSRYAAERDCEVWKGWQGSLVVAKNQIGRLVPERVVHHFPGLPAWSKGEDDPDEIKESPSSPDAAPHLVLGKDKDRQTTDLKRKSPFKDDSRPPKTSAFPFQSVPSASTSPGGNSPSEMTPSEKFLLTHESFPKGPGNRSAHQASERGVSPANSSSSGPGAGRGAPYPPPGRSGRPPLPPQNSLFALPPPKPFEPPQPKPSSFPPSPSHGQHPGSLLNPILVKPIPASIAEMASLILDLKSLATLFNAQHTRLSIVTRDPADWSLAIAHLTRTMMEEQEALENARRDRAKAEEKVKEWESLLQRNDVGIEERRGFVLDVLDMLDEGVLGQKQVILDLRCQINLDMRSLQERMAILPVTTVSVVQSSEDILSTLHHAHEEQRAAQGEAARRASVLAGLVGVRRNARGMWRDRREELAIVVRSLTSANPASSIAEDRIARSASVLSNTHRRSPSPMASRSSEQAEVPKMEIYVPPYISQQSNSNPSSMPAPSSFPLRSQPPVDHHSSSYASGFDPSRQPLPPPPRNLRLSPPARDQYLPPPPLSSSQAPHLPLSNLEFRGPMPPTAKASESHEEHRDYAGWVGIDRQTSGPHRTGGNGNDGRGGRDPRWGNGNNNGNGSNYGHGGARRYSRDSRSSYDGHGY